MVCTVPPCSLRQHEKYKLLECCQDDIDSILLHEQSFLKVDVFYEGLDPNRLEKLLAADGQRLQAPEFFFYT